MKKLYFLFLSVFIFNFIYAQCPIINSAMPNSCGSLNNEGTNEFIVFTTTASATAGSYSLYYGSTNPPKSSFTGQLLGINAKVKTGTGNITSTPGCVINEITSASSVIPANSIVIFIPEDFSVQYDVSSLCSNGSIYVVYIDRVSTSDWNEGGTLANNPSGARYLQVTNGSNNCTSEIRSYTSSWPSNIDGNAVSWNASGVATYVNNGCNIIPPPPGVNINLSTPVSVCQGLTSANITYTSTGSPDKYSLDWNAAANTAGFVDVVNATLTSSPLTITLPSTLAVGSSYTASLTATNTTTGITSTAQNITLNIIGKPVIANIIGITSICEGYTYYSLQNATAGGVWSSSNTAIATVNSTGALSGITPGNATISYTVTNTCGSTVSNPFNVTVISKPIVAEIVGSANICIGSTVAFTNSTPSGTWSTVDASIATISSSGNVTGIAAGTTLVNYSVTNSCGTTVKTFSITVGNSVTVPNITGSSNVCVGATTALSNATAGGTWSSSNTLVANINSSGLVTGVANGTATITYSVTTSCGNASKTFVITVNDKPIVAEITGANNLCIATTINLSNATAGGTWSSSNVSVATVNAAGTVTAITGGNATISYAVTNSCGTTTKALSVTVNDKPIVADISGSSSLCIASVATLSNATTGGIWSSSNTSIVTITNSGLVTGVSNGSATISYSVTNSCGTTTKTFSITVGGSITVPNITGSSNVCIGATSALGNATTGGTWASSNTAIATINSSGLVTGIASGTATITYSITSSCGNASNTLVITVNDKPTVAEITGANNMCIATTVNLSNATVGGTWSSSNTSIATVNSSGTVTGIAVGSSTINYAVTNSCGTTTKTLTITINDKPVVADISGSSNLCIAATATLSNATVGGAWSSSNISVATISNSGLITGVSNGSTTISYTVTNSCGTTIKNFALTVSDKPVVADITGSSSLCVATTLALTNTTAGGTWSSSNTSIATVNNTGIVTSVSAGTANMNYTVTNSCGSTTKSLLITVTDKPIVAEITGPATVNPNNTITLTDITTGGIWSSSNTTIATVTATGVVTGLTAGTVTISYAVTNSCGTTLKTYTVKVSDYDDIFIPNVFTPNGDGNNDFFQVYGTIITGLEMKIFNQWGEMIFETKDMNNKWNGSYYGKMQPTGVYVYVAKIKVQGGTIVTKKGSINLMR